MGLRLCRFLLWLFLHLLLSCFSQSDDVCESSEPHPEATFIRSIDLRIDFTKGRPSWLQLIFTGGNFNGEGFCFKWREDKDKYEVNTPKMNGFADLGSTGWENVTIKTIKDKMKLTAGGKTLEQHLKGAQADICYGVQLLGDDGISYEFIPIEGNACKLTTSKTTQTTTSPTMTSKQTTTSTTLKEATSPTQATSTRTSKETTSALLQDLTTTPLPMTKSPPIPATQKQLPTTPKTLISGNISTSPNSMEETNSPANYSDYGYEEYNDILTESSGHTLQWSYKNFLFCLLFFFY